MAARNVTRYATAAGARVPFVASAKSVGQESGGEENPVVMPDEDEVVHDPDEVKKKLRTIEVAQAKNGEYHYTVYGENHEKIYHSETFPRKEHAKEAARREHEGRSKFSYVLKWTDGRNGEVRRETL